MLVWGDVLDKRPLDPYELTTQHDSTTIKTHGSVLCGPKNGPHANYVSILTGTTKS